MVHRCHLVGVLDCLDLVGAHPLGEPRAAKMGLGRGGPGSALPTFLLAAKALRLPPGYSSRLAGWHQIPSLQSRKVRLRGSEDP